MRPMRRKLRLRRDYYTKPPVELKVEPVVPTPTPELILLEKYKPRTENQSNYTRAIANNDITMCFGLAGTGKTTCAIGYAITKLCKNDYSRIVITRPIIEASHKSIGALPGDIRNKINPYLLPMLEEFYKYVGKACTEKLITDGVIEIAPLEMMRGRTFNNAIIILDEAQNCSYEQLKMFLTRIGQNSKSVITADIRQSDLPYHLRIDFHALVPKLAMIPGFSICQLDKSDIQRSQIISHILEVMEEDESGAESMC